MFSQSGGCKRALTCGGNSSAKFSFYRCNSCDYDICDLCFENRKSKLKNKGKNEQLQSKTKKPSNERKKECSRHNMQQTKPKGQTWFCSNSKEPAGCPQNICKPGMLYWEHIKRKF